MMSIEAGKVFDHAPRANINPYLSAAAIVVRRLKWDIHPLSWQSRKKIKQWKGKYEGEKAVILCNGPSLNQVDFELLDRISIFTFGLNKINLLFEKTIFRPSCIVAVNLFVIEQNEWFYNATDIPIFLNSEGRKWVKCRKNICYLHCANLSGSFARDCSVSINQGGTVTYVAMQLAFHMGFSDVALVGCDHSFQTKGTAHKRIKAEQEDPDHFDPRYFANGVTWQLPDLAGSELHYETARNMFQHFGRRIVNCTAGGMLELFDRMDLAEFLQ